MRQRFLLLTLLVLLTTACYTFYAADACLRDKPRCFGTDESQLGNSEKAPFRYRILEPALINALAPSSSQDETILVATALQGLLITATLPLLYLWLMRWMNTDRAMLGVALFALVEIAAYHLWFISLSTSIEMLCVVIALLLMDKRWLWLLVPVVVIASLNRETSLLIVGIYAAWHGLREWRRTLRLLAVWAVITAAIHLIRGAAPHMLGLIGTLEYNISDFTRGGFFANLVLLPLYLLVVYGYRGAPALLKRLAWVAGVYTLAFVVGGAWGEIQRLVLPIMPLVIPLLFHRVGTVFIESTS